jgi:hypothetical protein
MVHRAAARLALPVALGTAVTTPTDAQTDEIQVYNDEITAPGACSFSR